MEVADIDGNGTIDVEEFKEMITKLDEKFDESKASEIFGSSDADGNGKLSVENFGSALYECLKLMKHEEQHSDNENE
jgi:Ca2+-binding EF-hand superfamily protein